MASLIVLHGGIVIWTQEPIIPGGPYILDVKDAVVLVPSQKPGDFQIIKLKDDLGKPKQIEYFPGAIQSIRDCNDQALNNKCRAALSGLVLA